MAPILRPQPDYTLSRNNSIGNASNHNQRNNETSRPTPHHYTLPRIHQTEGYYATPSNVPVPPNTSRHPTMFEWTRQIQPSSPIPVGEEELPAPIRSTASERRATHWRQLHEASCLNRLTPAKSMIFKTTTTTPLKDNFW